MSLLLASPRFRASSINFFSRIPRIVFGRGSDDNKWSINYDNGLVAATSSSLPLSGRVNFLRREHIVSNLY